MALEIVAGCPKWHLKKVYRALSKRIERRGFKPLPAVGLGWETERYSEADFICGPPCGLAGGIGNIGFNGSPSHIVIELPFHVCKWTSPEDNVKILIHYAATAYVLHYWPRARATFKYKFRNVALALGAQENEFISIGQYRPELVKMSTVLIYGKKTT